MNEPCCVIIIEEWWTTKVRITRYGNLTAGTTRLR